MKRHVFFLTHGVYCAAMSYVSHHCWPLYVTTKILELCDSLFFVLLEVVMETLIRQTDSNWFDYFFGLVIIKCASCYDE